ncbi:sulfite exporter TauE/SafE family protein [Marinicella sp. W31]|uniref:sulfite exporter TauE/SafE family protein n=1 Tax=Marinicella sp. W31 TaxID=3023713 RepID=UPI0037577788
MIEISVVLLFILLGCTAGFVAGLLGVGGGGIMVPILAAIFLDQGIPQNHVMHLALGTSMASIVMTAISSTMAHHKRNAVLWPIFRAVAPGVVVGTFLATFLVAIVNTMFLALFFSAFMALVAFQLFWGLKPDNTRPLLSHWVHSLVGTIIGAVSALVSIGGGSMTVPYLAWQNVPIARAIATSAAIGLPIALAGTLGFIINGYGINITNEITGFIYWPAVLIISIGSFLFAPIGAKLAHTLPVPVLKKVFACLVLFLSIRMLYTVII